METMQDLNSNTLIGNTDKRGTAWHYRADLQGAEPNHYAGAVPVADVARRLFNWEAASRRMAMEVPADLDTMTHLDEHGVPMRWVLQDDLQGIARGDNDHRMGVFKAGYEMHQYQPWLLDQVANLLDDDLGISSAGLLRQGAIAWVEVSVPDTITTPEGVEFRPNLLATTSFDGSIATTYKRTVTDVVCDNTRALALAEQGQTYRVKHSRYSTMRIADARDALAMVHTAADDFAAQVAQLCAVAVAPRQWTKFLDLYVPTTDARGQALQGRQLSGAERKRGNLQLLWSSDARVAPWAGTAQGVVQAVNTYEHHVGNVRGQRAERNMLRTVTGEWDGIDRGALAVLDRVLAN